MKKKLLAIVMSLTMILVFMPSMAFAEGPEVTSIAFMPAEQKIVYDYYLIDECELTEDGYLYYPELMEGDSIEITYKDGTTAAYKVTEGDDGAFWENENDPDDVIPMEDFSFIPACIPENAANNDSFNFEVEYLNVKTSGKVVFKSNISKITYTPKANAITLYKGVDEKNDDGDTYFDIGNAYDYLYGFWNDRVMIEYNDGTPSETFALDELGNWEYVIEKNGEYISLREFQQDTPWAVGNTYDIFLKAKGKVDTNNKITVTIENSPVTGFSFKQSTKYLYVFNGGGEEQDIEYDASSDEYYLGDGSYNGYAGAEGDVLTFEYKDGTKKVFEYGRIENDPDYPHGWDGFVTDDGNGNKSRLEREITFDTTGQKWTSNGDGQGHYYNNTVELNYMGARSNEKLKSYVGYQVWFYDEYDENEGEYITHANSCTPIGMSFKDSGVEIFEPEREGYTLVGWYEMDQNGKLYDEPYNFDEPVTKETFLYAKWEEAADCEHNYVTTITKAPTCIENGVKTYTCTNCGETRTETILATGHQWNTTYTVDVPATESAAGSQSIHCAVCGTVKEGSSQVIPQLTPSTPTPAPESEPASAPSEEIAEGSAVVLPAGTVTVTSADSQTVAFTKAPNKKSVTVPDTVTINGQKYTVTEINSNAFTGKKIRTVTIGKNVKTIKKNAFKGSAATKLIVKTKKLKKAKVKGSLKGSKVKTIQIKVGKKADNKKYVKTYKKIFTKSNAGKKVTVK